MYRDSRSYGNMEITETLIFVKCHDLTKMQCFGQNATILRFLQDFLVLLSIS